MVGALVGAISTHLLRERAEVRREERELRGLLRLVSAELTINDRTMEMLLHNHGGSHGDFEDAAWKHANVRLEAIS